MTDHQRRLASPTKITPLGSAVSAVAETILRRLPCRGEEAPSESELAGELRISHRSARRALATLEAVGVLDDGPSAFEFEDSADRGRLRLLADTRPEGIGRLLRLILLNNGTHGARGIVDVRVAVERTCMSAAATAVNEHSLRALRRLVTHMRAPRIPPQQFGQLDRAFHLRIAHIAGGLRESLLYGLSDPIAAQMEQAFDRVEDWPHTARRLADEHEHLLTLVSADKGDEAADFVAHHVEHFYESGPPTARQPQHERHQNHDR